jgi:rare lipoprotein A
MKYPNKMVPARLGLYTQKIVKPVFKARGLMEGKIMTHWHQIVGEKFARLALAEKITFPKGKKTEGTLHLNVTSAGSLLLHYAQDLILEQVNTFFGYKALSKLHMSHGFTPPEEVKPKQPLPPLSEEENQWLDSQTQAIEDPELKQCLKNLGEGVLSPMRQRFSSLFALIVGAALLSACSSGPECPEICTMGTTLAPKKATSRPYQIKGVWYYPQPHYEYDEVGLASYYGEGDIFHGRPTATGEIFDKNGITGAHKTLPLPCMVEVTNLENGRQIQMKVNDRGPFIEGRIIDLSYRVAQLLGSAQKGVVKVRVRTLVPETLALNGIDPATVMVAQAAPPPSSQPEVLIPERPAVVAVATLPTLPQEIFKKEEKPTILAKASTEPLATGIFVDVGAHPTLEEAKKLSSQMDKLTDSPIAPIKSKGAKPYVVRIGPLPSMSQANQMLDQLTRAGHAMSRIVIHR